MLGTIDLTGCGSIYEFNLGISEETTESILTDYLHEQGGKVNRSSRLVGLTPHANGVLAEIDSNGERYQVDARWVVGCDGIHSPTRELSGIHLEGHDITNPWAVFDATMQGWTDTYRNLLRILRRRSDDLHGNPRSSVARLFTDRAHRTPISSKMPAGPSTLMRRKRLSST